MFDGVSCGTCAGTTESCTADGVCEDACYARECGLTQDGIDCGVCPGATHVCSPDGTCEDACALRECGSPSPGIDCGDCSATELCGITGRCFTSGTCPPDMIEVLGSGVCIDPYEATNTHFAAFLNSHGNDCEVAGEEPFSWLPEPTYPCYIETFREARIDWTGSRWEVETGWEQHPAVAATFWGAQLACEHWGKTLCTEEAWKLACGGPSGSTFPYGDTHDASACNACNLPLGGCGDRDVEPVGSFPDCEGGYPGIYDMTGNAAEWVDACVFFGASRYCPYVGSGPIGPVSQQQCWPPEGQLSTEYQAYQGNQITAFRCCLFLD